MGQLEQVVTTRELLQRTQRSPNHQAENQSLVTLADELSSSPHTVLQRLVEILLTECGAGSTGVSLLEQGPEERFRWYATAGEFARYQGECLPRHFSPCGIVLDENAVQMMRYPVRHFEYISGLHCPVVEVLLVPFHSGVVPIGTIWVVAHDDTKCFDAEDARLMRSLSRFASAAVEVQASRDAAKLTANRERQAASEAQAAAEANAKFRFFFEQGSQFAGLMTLDGVIVEANRLCLEFCGFSRDEIVGKHFWECGWWNRSSELMALVRNGSMQAARGEMFRAETKYFLADGTERIVDLILAPVKDTAGNVLFVAPTGSDITGLKNSEDALRIQAEQLREADRQKDEFLAMLAHELRNPLVPVRTGLDLLSIEGAGLDLVRPMQQQIEHIVRLVDDLMDVSRMMVGKVELRREPVEFSTIIGQAVEAIRPRLKVNRQSFIVDVAPEAIWIDGDRVRLVQVVSNLLHNSSKYTPQGGSIRLSAERAGAEVVLNIVDSGAGIDPDLLPHVFELFRQAKQSIDRPAGGLGIGLTLVKRLVELHGGQVAVHSDGVNRGSEFTVRLPTILVPGRETRPAARDDSTAGCRLLVVDDNVSAAVLLGRLLQKLGSHEITTAYDGSTAMEMAFEHEPDAILLDIGLPELDGYEVARRLRALPRFRDTLLIALTGYGAAEDRRKAIEAGFDEHLVKPPSIDMLRQVLRHPKLRHISAEHSHADAATPQNV